MSEAGKTCVAVIVSAANAAAESAIPSVAAMKRVTLMSPSGCLASAGHLTILSGDDRLHGVRANRPRARCEAVPAVLSGETRAQLRAGTRAHRRNRARVFPEGVRPRASRRAQAAELRGLPAALPRAQLPRHRRGADESGLPAERVRVRAGA